MQFIPYIIIVIFTVILSIASYCKYKEGLYSTKNNRNISNALKRELELEKENGI